LQHLLNVCDSELLYLDMRLNVPGLAHAIDNPVAVLLPMMVTK